jgi:hypothetical protein
MPFYSLRAPHGHVVLSQPLANEKRWRRQSLGAQGAARALQSAGAVDNGRSIGCDKGATAKAPCTSSGGSGRGSFRLFRRSSLVAGARMVLERC